MHYMNLLVFANTWGKSAHELLQHNVNIKMKIKWPKEKDMTAKL
jgi:hypothetical protein